MDVVVMRDAGAVCARAADIVAKLVRGKPQVVLALPTGRTPVAMYAELVRLHRDEALSFSGTTAFNLDEYIGLPPGHPASCRAYLDQHFYRHVDLPPMRAISPDVGAVDRRAACARYETEIAAAGGLDLACLGIGGNGHIAFNEPPAAFGSRTRVAMLRPETRRANAAAFGDIPVPEAAITMGVETILGARRCVLLATGAGKADAVARVVDGIPAADSPASALKLHADAVLLLDGAAAGRLAH
jgi:glucosamine-6-phosphate deaminase